jgi:hypothetical protein
VLDGLRLPTEAIRDNVGRVARVENGDYVCNVRGLNSLGGRLGWGTAGR